MSSSWSKFADNDAQLHDRNHLDGDLIGRGLGMVQSLAERWGIERHPDGGKIVWAEIAFGRGESGESGETAGECR